MIDQTSRPELTGEQGEVLANPEQFLASATEYLVDTGMVDRDQITPEVAQHIRNVGEVIGIAPDQAIYYHPNNGKFERSSSFQISSFNFLGFVLANFCYFSSKFQ